MNKEVFIVLHSDNNYVKYLLPCIKSIVSNKKSDTILKINIFSDNIDNKYKDEINSYQKQNISIIFIDILQVYQDCNYTNTQNKQLESFSIRLLIPHFFKKQSKILYIDADTIVKKDLLDLFQQDIGDNYISALKTSFPNNEFCKNFSNFKNKDCNILYKKILNINENTLLEKEYINSGIILFNNAKIIKDNKQKDLQDNLIKFSNQLPWIDQDILTKVFLYKIQNLSVNYNCMNLNLGDYLNLSKSQKYHYLQNINQATIIHYIHKPNLNRLGKVTESNFYLNYLKQTSFYTNNKLKFLYYTIYHKNWLIFKISSKYYLNKLLFKIFNKNFLDC